MESVLRGLAIYFALLLIVRLSGRRTLAQMTPFDLVIILVISETTQQAMLANDFSITNAILLILTLFLKKWSPPAGRVIDGVPVILVANGAIDREALRGCRLQVDDILEAARTQQGIEEMREIRFAILEVSGAISIIKAQ
jgi:uncharacterized membrane protein YcaP (DUF421 family)